MTTHYAMTTRWLVIDNGPHTARYHAPVIMGDYAGRIRARNRADKLDLGYGAYRYSVCRVEVPADYRRADLSAALALSRDLGIL